MVNRVESINMEWDTLDITAYDEAGNTFPKKVTVIDGESGLVVDFGWPVRYYVVAMTRGYPYDNDWCIDAMGRNHKYSSVFVKKEDINAMLEYFGFVDGVTPERT